VFVDPGVTLARCTKTFTLSTPIRACQKLSKTLTPTLGAGDLARIVVFVGYSRRF